MGNAAQKYEQASQDYECGKLNNGKFLLQFYEVGSAKTVVPVHHFIHVPEGHFMVTF